MSLLFTVILSSKLVITEVMANPRGGDGAHYPEDRNEFVELYNAGDHAVDLFNYIITDGDAQDVIRAWQDSTILNQHPNVIIGTTWLKPGGYAVILDQEYLDPEAIGGWVQPYRFGDSTLMVTVGNTTIGNGLSNNDPVIISGYEDSSSFGTPFLNDGFPYNAGDGYSWERVDISGPDGLANWAVCPETSGCTPGMANAFGLRIDLALAELELIDSAGTEPADSFGVRVRVENHSYVVSPKGTIQVWFYPDETVAESDLPPMGPKTETVFVFSGRVPQVPKELWVRLEVPRDYDTSNNRGRLMVYPQRENRVLSLNLNGFSPNGDGFEDSLLIRFQLPEKGGGLTIKVFNLAGKPIKTLLDKRMTDQIQGQVYWNGAGDRGEVVPAGVYAVLLDYKTKRERVRTKLPVVLIR